MADAASNERLIGQMETKLEMLMLQVDRLATQIEVNRRESSEGRSRVYREIETMGLGAIEVKAKVEALTVKLDENLPAMTRWKNWEQRLIGMQILFGVMWMVVGGGLMLAWKWIAAKVGL